MLKLKIEGLSCSIKNKEILKDITVSFQQGEMAAVLGRNGAGKTTFIRCIANQIAHQGSIVLEEDGKKLGRSSIAYLPQLEKITSSLTTFETILLGLTKTLSWKVSEAQLAKVSQVIRELKLDAFANTPVRSLSGGQKQLVFLAQSFVSEPRLLLLDEPTSALDSKTEINICKTIDEISKDRTVITVAHRLNTIRDYDRIYVLDRGEIVEQGTHSELMTMHGRYAHMYKEFINKEMRDRV